MDANKILADFQLAANRVSKYQFETKATETGKAQVKLIFDIDFDILNINEDSDRFIGTLEFITTIKAKVKNSIVFKMDLVMEGVFIGNPNKLELSDFKNMLKLNGIATLSHLSRSYLLSVSALSGINPPIKLPLINVHNLIEYKSMNEASKEL